MRVLWLSHFLPFPATGHGALQRSHHLLLELASNHETALVTFASGDAAADANLRAADALLAPSLAFMDVVVRRPRELAWLRAVSLARTSIGHKSYWEYWFADQRYRQAVRSRLADFSPDIIYADTAFLAQYAPPDRPLAVTHHNVESDLLEQRSEVNSGLRRWFWRREAIKAKALEHRTLRQASLNIAVSKDDAAHFCRVAPKSRIAVVPNGVDVAYFGAEHATISTARSLVFAGGMDWYPNRDAIDWCVSHLWPLLAGDRDGWQMTVVGRNPPVSAIHLAASDSRFRVTGFVDDVRPIVTAAAAYLCPIRVGGGTRLKILDALAMERPLVSTGVGVSGLGLEEERHYLRAESPEEFLHQLQRLDSDPALAERLASAGRSFVETRYAWGIVGQQFVHALASAVSGEPEEHARVPVPRST